MSFNRYQWNHMVPSFSRESEFDLLSFHDNNLIFYVFVIVHLCICKFWRWVDLWAECRNILWNSKLCPRFTIGQINKVTLKLYLTTLSGCVCHTFKLCISVEILSNFDRLGHVALIGRDTWSEWNGSIFRPTL